MNKLPDGCYDKGSFKFLPFHGLHNFILRNKFEKYSAHCLTLDMLNSNKDTLKTQKSPCEMKKIRHQQS